jgi:hypothetical protein
MGLGCVKTALAMQIDGLCGGPRNPLTVLACFDWGWV